VDPIDDARQRYEAERSKRLRADGQSQYLELTDRYADFDVDPWVEPGFTRDAIEETDLDAVIVGAGFGGMLTAVALKEQGIENFRIVEKAGDFGGVWYWNRYPGCMCDVESLIYLPLLEETGYTPTVRYAPAQEIFEHCQRIGETFDLYPKALFQTEIESAVWDEDADRWQITTTRGDRLTTRFFVTAGGILHKAKLPGIKGIEDFEGAAFHSARWDYGFTGGSPTEPMTGLADKRVGIIGTGATSIQIVPQLARAAKDVYVFQRTPSAVGARNNGPIPEGWVAEQPAGWQLDRMRNFTECVTGAKPDRNLVGDGATHVLWEDTSQAAKEPERRAELERIDFEIMEEIRQRVADIVTDPDTAAKLQPWYGKHCKRVTYHDEYLQAFNEPNVHLVDTDGRGVQEISAAGPVVDGVEYPLDLLIYASGFEVTTGLAHRLGFDPIGRDGVALSERWADGAHTLHGVFTNGFPNLLVCHFVQAGYGLNYQHYLRELTTHLAAVIADAKRDGVETIEATVEAEDEWLHLLWGIGKGFGRYSMACTPSFNNSEGEATMHQARNIAMPGDLMRYVSHIDEWRAAGDRPGTVVTTAAADPA
jgi:cation diffusion facilitator CzcD-associated flavoprotein CzcO